MHVSLFLFVESSDEGISLSVTSEYGDDSIADELRREITELRSQLEHERRMRMILEEQNRALEAQLYPDRLRQIASQVQIQMKLQQEKEVCFFRICKCSCRTIVV